MKTTCLFSSILLFSLLFLSGTPHADPGRGHGVTVLLPSIPWLEKMDVSSEDKNKPRGRAGAKTDSPEVDILISMMDPYANVGMDMDMPQTMAAFMHAPGGESANFGRIDLLGDIEEIRYRDKKAWGVNMALEKAGLYQFIMDAKPWWDEEKGIYHQHQVKVVLPVATDAGWHLPAGQSFEILPLSRPFGLSAPAAFSGRVLLDGKPAPDVTISMGRINSPRIEAQTRWHETLAARTDQAGQFSFVLDKPGWWYCEANIDGAPLKGPDGELKPVIRSAIFWLYVNPAQSDKGKK